MARFHQPASAASNAYRVEWLDLLLAFVAPVLAFWVRDPALFDPSNLDGALIYIALAFVSTAVACAYFRIGDILPAYISLHDAEQILQTACTAVIVTAILAFSITRLESVPRSIPIIHLLILSLGLAGTRYLRRILSAQPREAVKVVAETDKGNILLIGANQLGGFYVRLIDHFARNQQRIVAILDEDFSLQGRTVGGHRIVGSPLQLATILSEFGEHGVFIDKVVIADPGNTFSSFVLSDIERICRERTLVVEHVAERLGLSDHAANATETITPLASKMPERQLGYYWQVKRGFDVLISTIALVVTLPAMVLTAIIVLINFGLPLLFWQERLGRNGKPFSVYKFRTLRPPFDGSGRPITNIKRFSRASSFLRATRLDELPQLFNILMGQMSLIGPRPLLPVDQPDTPSLRLQVRPGLTGWAQVHGGKLINPDEKNALDEWYIRNASLALDLRILLATLKTVVRGDRRDERIVSMALEEKNQAE